MQSTKTQSNSIAGTHRRIACPSCGDVQTVDTVNSGSPLRCEACGEFGIVPKQMLAENVVIGDFILRKLIAETPHGQFFHAWQRSLERDCAIKFLTGDTAEEQQKREVIAQVRRAISFTHPGLVQYYSVGYADGVPFYTMEYVRGRNLADLLREGRNLKLGVALDYLDQILCALAAIWESRHIAHTGITPRSILITESGVVKLTDMGLIPYDLPGASPEGHDDNADRYRSPESIHGEPGDFRSDIFSLGLVVMEAITGKNPYAEISASDKTTRRFRLPELAELTTEVPSRVSAVISKMVAPAPDMRHPNYESLRTELDAARLVCPQSILCQDHLRYAEILAEEGLVQAPRAGQHTIIRWLAALLVVSLVAFAGGRLLTSAPAGESQPASETAQPGPLQASVPELKIVSLLPDPEGYDPGKETVTIANTSSAGTADLAGFVLADEQNSLPLSGLIEAGQERVITLPSHTVVLANTGNTLFLKNPAGRTIDQVAYTRNDVTPGEAISIVKSGQRTNASPEKDN